MFRKKPLRINTYRGYGSENLFRASGRALEDENVDFNSSLNTFKTLRNIFKQLESDEISNAYITIKLSDGRTFEVMTDGEGYYHFSESMENLYELTDEEGWVSYSVSYSEGFTTKKISSNNSFASEMLIPSHKAEYGVISDIDDTILHTGVASLFKWRVIANTLFKNYDKRLPIEGVTNFYQKLHLGSHKEPVNPFFYVSNSPWNLYDYLSAFLKKHLFPNGPILLRDFRTPFDKTPKPELPHKQSEILNLLNTYPDLKFILIGDSGEKDADIYTQIAQQYPERILAIYLRDVNHKRRTRRIQKLIDGYQTTPILLMHNALDAINHAKKHGFII